MNQNPYGPPPGFSPPPFGYGPPPGAMPPPNPMGSPMPPRTHGLAIASMICGILALFPGCCCGLFGLPLSIAAVVMGLLAMSQINQSGGQLGGKGMAIAGVVCGGVAIAVNVLGVVFNVTNQLMSSRSFHF